MFFRNRQTQIFSALTRLLLSSAVFILVSCSGGGDTPPSVENGDTQPSVNNFTVGGNVQGLSGTGLTLQNNGINNLAISADGNFSFSVAFASGSSYSVTIATQPSGQICSVTNGTGTINGANITNVQVSCAVTYTVGGTVSGLTGTGLVLQNNSGNNLSVSANVEFTFSTALASGTGYSVSVASQPTGQSCLVNNGIGIVSGANITNVTIVCGIRTYTIGGTIFGLGSARSMELNMNGVNSEHRIIVANGAFTFPTAVSNGTTYNVSINAQPFGQRCTTTNGSGNVSNADITDIAVNCNAPVADNWVTNGRVVSSALSSDGNTIYIAGDFTRVGPRSGGGVPVETSSGTAVASYPRVEGIVHASASDNAGGWYIGGKFRFVGNLPRNNIAHIRADGSVNPDWNPDATSIINANATVNTIVVAGSTVYVGGEFSRIGGQPRNALAALSTVTGLATSWDAAAVGVNFWPGVNVLKLSGQTLYIGGGFSSIGGQARTNLAALDVSTGLATPWSPNPNGSIVAMDLSDQAVYVSGSFGSIGNQSRFNLAAVDRATGLATNWNPAPNGLPYTLAISGQTLYTAGRFLTIGGQTRRGIAALSLDTGLASTLNVSGNDNITTLAISGQMLYIGGSFTTIGSRTQPNLAAMDLTTGLITSWSPVVNDTVTSIGVSGPAIYIGGQFSLIGGTVRNYIAALNTNTGMATDWNPDANLAVRAVGVSGSTVYVGGSFTRIGGQSRNALAALDATTGLANLTWNPNANNNSTTFPGSVSKLAISGQTVYIHGNFINVGGQPRSQLAALDATTGLATAWNPGSPGAINTFVISGQTLYLGGVFSSVAGQPRTGCAAFDTSTGLLTAWNPSLSTTANALVINSITTSGSTAYIAGNFVSSGGQASAGITAVDASSGLSLGWNPYPTHPLLGWITYSLASNGQDVYLGGDLSLPLPGTPQSLVALDASTGLGTNWNPQVSGTVLSLTVSNAVIYAGGNISTVGSTAIGNFVFLPR